MATTIVAIGDDVFRHLAHKQRNEEFRVRVAGEAGVLRRVGEVWQDARGRAVEVGAREGVESLGEGADEGDCGGMRGRGSGVGSFDEKREEQEGEDGVGEVVDLYQPVLVRLRERCQDLFSLFHFLIFAYEANF